MTTTGAPAPAAARAPAPHRPWAASARWRLGAFCAGALLLLLPALVAGRHLTAPPRADELARLSRALAPPAGNDFDGEVARQFYRSCAGAVAGLPDDADGQREVLTRARVGQGVGLFGVTLLLYLVVALARGRLHALLACACLAVVPAIAAEGHVLRPETPAALFAALAVLLLQCVAHETRQGRAARDRRFDVSRFGLALCAMVAVGLAVATLPTHGALLLVPGVVLSIAALQLAMRGGRIVHRSGWLRLPVRALNRRLLPWTAMALATPAVALWLLSATVHGPIESLSGTQDAVGFLPGDPWLAGAFAGVLGVGAIAALLHVGGHLRRSGRIAPDLVLLVFCAVVFAASLGAPPGTDRLPLAVATAAVLAEGAFVLLLLGQRVLSARGRARGVAG